MDKNYWESFYAKNTQNQEITNQSSFSVFCKEKFFSKRKLTIVEIGSGNGRDAIYFAKHGHKVFAIDQSQTAIGIEISNISKDLAGSLVPIADDFIKHDYDFSEKIDVFYSRFTLHAISQNDEDVLLPKIYESLEVGGLFCIEARTIKDPLCGKGEVCGVNTFLTDHRRRFIDSKIFIKQVLSLGFELVFFTEEDNLSVYKDDNPVLMRIILVKK